MNTPLTRFTPEHEASLRQYANGWTCSYKARTDIERELVAAELLVTRGWSTTTSVAGRSLLVALDALTTRAENGDGDPDTPPVVKHPSHIPSKSWF